MNVPEQEKVLAAAAQADAHELILHLPDGYDTQIGLGGSVLSAGQRQRIGLARALYGEPSLIVLDEPNANLDQDGEQALRTAITRTKKAGRTVILIAHHTNVLTVCDKLLVLRNGRVEQFGPKDEVVASLTRPAASSARQSIRAVD
jgi:ABC-type protease/lipase transport system fused ATPase/permease subunit